jgi:hypothetical protein
MIYFLFFLSLFIFFTLLPLPAGWQAGGRQASFGGDVYSREKN